MKVSQNVSNSKNQIKLMIAEFFLCGRSPIAPGTVGSIGSLIIWVPAVYFLLPNFIIASTIVAIFFIGVWASEYGIEYYKKSDPKQVVIDEVVGQGIPFLVIGFSIKEILAAFLLFRFFDIVKPWPIKWIEKRFDDKWGIMLDDVLAGIFALVAILLAKKFIF